MKSTLYILLFFVAGLLLSYLKVLPVSFTHDDLSLYALYVLMFLVGVGIGADPKSFQVIRSMKARILLVPLSTIVGTFLGLLILIPFMPYTFFEVQAIGAGYGYYSLSSIIIAEMRVESLGVIALLSNVIREIITLLLTPLLARFFGKLAPISSGGATSMDTTLPIITRFVGKEYAIISVFHGTVLTILVPVIVTGFLSI